MKTIDQDHFGRPARAHEVGVLAVAITVLFAGSLWPPRPRSITPPLDTPADGGHVVLDLRAPRRRRAPSSIGLERVAAAS